MSAPGRVAGDPDRFSEYLMSLDIREPAPASDLPASGITTTGDGDDDDDDDDDNDDTNPDGTPVTDGEDEVNDIADDLGISIPEDPVIATPTVHMIYIYVYLPSCTICETDGGGGTTTGDDPPTGDGDGGFMQESHLFDEGPPRRL